MIIGKTWLYIVNVIKSPNGEQCYSIIMASNGTFSQYWA